MEESLFAACCVISGLGPDPFWAVKAGDGKRALPIPAFGPAMRIAPRCPRHLTNNYAATRVCGLSMRVAPCMSHINIYSYHID